MVVLRALVLPVAMMVVIREVRRLADSGVLLGEQVVELDVEGRHGAQLLQHLRQQALQVLLGLRLLRRELLHARCGVKDRSEEVDDVGLLLAILVKAFEQVGLVVAPEQAFDLVDGAFGQLSHELLPVSVLDLEEARQVIGLKQHQPDETAVELLVAFDLVLELTALVPVQLLFIHWKGQPLDDAFKVVRERQDSRLTFTA